MKRWRRVQQTNARLRELIQAGGIPMKQWAMQEAERLGVTKTWIHYRLKRYNKYPDHRVIYLNKRVVVVFDTKQLPRPLETDPG